MSGQTQTSGNSAGFSRFGDTIKDFWVSRPRRPEQGRKVAGVAAALGNRYRIDPVVVRVIFVAITIFGGIGVVLYLLGWLFFPKENEQASAIESLFGKGRSSTSAFTTIVLGIAVFIFANIGFFGAWSSNRGWFDSNGWFDGGGFIALILVLAGLYLLHRDRGQFNRPQTHTGAGEAAVAANVVSGSSSSSSSETVVTNASSSAAEKGPISAEKGTVSTEEGTVSTETNSASTEPSSTSSGSTPGWDPLGANPSSWSLGDTQSTSDNPYQPPPSSGGNSGGTSPAGQPQPKTKVGALTFGVALLVAGLGVVLAITGQSWFSAPHIIGLVIGVLGLGMLAGAFVGGGRGLIAAAIPVGLVGIVLSSPWINNFHGGFGETTETPLTATDIKPIYQRSAGKITLDLTKLPANVDVNTKVSNGAGSSTVLVPATADVQFSCKTGVGQVDCLNRTMDGVGNNEVAATDLGTDGPGGQKITVAVENGAGYVEVRRA